MVSLQGLTWKRLLLLLYSISKSSSKGSLLVGEPVPDIHESGILEIFYHIINLFRYHRAVVCALFYSSDCFYWAQNGGTECRCDHLKPCKCGRRGVKSRVEAIFKCLQAATTVTDLQKPLICILSSVLTQVTIKQSGEFTKKLSKYLHPFKKLDWKWNAKMIEILAEKTKELNVENCLPSKLYIALTVKSLRKFEVYKATHFSRNLQHEILPDNPVTYNESFFDADDIKWFKGLRLGIELKKPQNEQEFRFHCELQILLHIARNETLQKPNLSVLASSPACYLCASVKKYFEEYFKTKLHKHIKIEPTGCSELLFGLAIVSEEFYQKDDHLQNYMENFTRELIRKVSSARASSS